MKISKISLVIVLPLLLACNINVDLKEPSLDSDAGEKIVEDADVGKDTDTVIVYDDICEDLYPKMLKADDKAVTYLPGSIMPCGIFTPARLNEEDVEIDIGQVFFDKVYGNSKVESIMIFISAEGCSYCESLGQAISARSEEFDKLNVLMIGMARESFYHIDYDTIFEAEILLREIDGWPTEKWYVTNDFEQLIPTGFTRAFPTIVIVDVPSMIIYMAGAGLVYADNTGVDQILNILKTL